MAEVKCPKCACKLELGKALVHKEYGCFGPSSKAVLEVVLKCPICGYSTTKD